MNVTKRDPARCSHTGMFGTYHLSQCTRKASVTEEGKGWCKQHAPSSVKARDEARSARWKSEEEFRNAQYAVNRARNAVVLAAEAYVASAKHLEANKNLSHADNAQLIEAVRLLDVAEARLKVLNKEQVG